MDGSKIDYDLNIIDTPGFGDQSGIIRDKSIVDRIREFLTTPSDHGLTCLDAVCFVTQAPITKIFPEQKSIFESILSFFGQDLAKNIFVLITFADGNMPPVVNALKKANVPFKNFFKFNNSALFASSVSPQEDTHCNLYWKIGRDSFRIFFDELQLVDSNSLQLTTEVLLLRKNLEARIQELQEQVENIIQEKNSRRYDTRSRRFLYTEEREVRRINLFPNEYATNCIICNMTCHFPCLVAPNENMSKCEAMAGGICKVCPKTCNWTKHRSNQLPLEMHSVAIMKIDEELQKRYKVEEEEEMKRVSFSVKKIEDAFVSTVITITKMFHDINKLNEIALLQNPLNALDYIDLLIENEKTEKKNDWEQRLEVYYDLKKKAEHVACVNPNFVPD